MKLLFASTWSKQREKTWSGTTYSLYNALSSKIEVRDIDLTLNKLEKMLVKLFSLKNFKMNNGKISIKSDFSSILFKVYKRKLGKKIDNINTPVLQIGDYGVSKNDTYVYQDLSVDSLIYYKNKHNDLFNFSTFQDYDEKDLLRRQKKQKEFYENCNGIFTMSKWLSKNLVEYSKISSDKVYWVGAGINIDVNNIKNINKSNNKILFVGRDFMRKGGDLTYQAFKILKEKYIPNAELYVAGPKTWPMDNMIEGVIFLGDLPASQLSHYFNICDIFCMPSRFEAYGLVFIEALVYGLPCIGRDEFEMNEFIQDGYNGLLIKNDNIDELALKMYNLLNNDEIKENIVRNRQKYIKEYSWDTVADRIINVIRNDNKLNSF